MVFLYIILLLLFIYLLLFFFLPRGNVIHELIHLPTYWKGAFTVPIVNLTTKRYNYGKQRRQYLLHFQPKQKLTEKKNVIVYFHGGGWGFGRPGQFKTNAQVFTDEGYEVFMPSYRRTPQYNYYHIRKDITNAMGKILDILQRENKEEKNIIIGGTSAGGNLAALILYDRAELAMIGLTQEKFSGIFLIGAPLDMDKMDSTPPVWFYAGRRKSKQFRSTNPCNFIKEKETVPVLCIHGTKDGLVRYQNAKSFERKLNNCTPNLIEFMTLENGTHLDAARWSYQEGEVRSRLLKWLSARENEPL